MDIQLILEIKISFGKCHPICPKILKVRFLGHPVDLEEERYKERVCVWERDSVLERDIVRINSGMD